jgi:hypothetical protein
VVELLSCNRQVRGVLLAEAARCAELLKPARRDEVMALLGKLILHYPQMNMGDNQLQVLFEDYLDDLVEFPSSAIAAACKEYRLNPENRFFPSIGWLVSRSKDSTYPLRHRLKIIERILSAEPPKPQRSVTAEQWAELRRSLGAEMRGASKDLQRDATVEMMRKSGAPEADIEAFLKAKGVAA